MRDPRFFPPEGVCERTCGDQREVAKSDTLAQTLTAELKIREEIVADCVNQDGCVAAPHTESGRLAIELAIKNQHTNPRAISKGGIL